MKHSMGQRGASLKVTSRDTKHSTPFNQGKSSTKTPLKSGQIGEKGDSKKDFGLTAPSVIVVSVGVHGASTGKILNLHKGMEYSSNNGSSWSNVTGNKIESLSAGKYLIRWKKYGKEDDSDIQTEKITQPGVLDGTVAITGRAEVGETLTADVSAITAKADGSYDDASIAPVLAYQWKKDGVSITDATNATYVVVEGDKTHAITVSVSSTNCGGTKTSESVTPTDPTYVITVTNDGNGSASAGVARASAGTTVTLTATANEGYEFDEWEVVSGTVTITSNAFTMPSEAVEVKAKFTEIAAS